MSDLLNKAREKMGGLERRIADLPIVRDYKDKEMRREVDKRVRQQLMDALERTRAALTDLQQDVLSTGGLQWMDEMERINSRLTLLADKVRSAAYGYRPLFDLDRVREVELDRLLRFDQNILARTPELDEHLAAAREAVSESAEAFGKALRELYAAAGELIDLYTRREQVVRGEEVEAPPAPEQAQTVAAEGATPTAGAEPPAGSETPATTDDEPQTNDEEDVSS